MGENFKVDALKLILLEIKSPDHLAIVLAAVGEDAIVISHTLTLRKIRCLGFIKHTL